MKTQLTKPARGRGATPSNTSRRRWSCGVRAVVPVSNCTGEMRFCAASRDLAGRNGCGATAGLSNEFRRLQRAAELSRRDAGDAAEDLREMARAGVTDFERDFYRKLFLSGSRISRMVSMGIKLEGVT